MATAPAPERRNTADSLAKIVFGLSALLIAVLSSLAIGLADEQARPDTAKNVLNAVLPLIASWVGTVLAYYYSRENLTTATRNATEMAQQLGGVEKLQVIRVRDAMIPVASIDTMPVDETTRLKDIIEFLGTRGRQRLPIFGDQRVRFIVHLSTINAFLTQSALRGDPIADLTFGALLKDTTHAALLRTSFGVVAVSATLADVKAVLEKGRDREDVFITDSGSPDEPVLGWITDNDLVRASRA